MWSPNSVSTISFLLIGLLSLAGGCKPSTVVPAPQLRSAESGGLSIDAPADFTQAAETPDAVMQVISQRRTDTHYVRPGESIQAALDAVAEDPTKNRVAVLPGTYRPPEHRQALIWFNKRHDGITLEAEGEVILTAENPKIADKSVASYPAVVNHVVYFGDGISRKTTLRGFKITGANHFVTQSDDPEIQPAVFELRLRERTFVYYADGGGIKIWGRSYPTIDRVEVYNNYTSPCAGAISIENRGYIDDAPLITNSIFRNNRSQITGAAIDLFDVGNRAEIRNCLFVGNVTSRGLNFFVFPRQGFHGKHGSSSLTVFNGSHVVVDRCTFTGNYNGVDDASSKNVYTNCIFWKNDATGGIAPEGRYEIDIRDAAGVKGCFFGGGTILDLRNTLPAENSNRLDAPDPEFDEHFQPRNGLYQDAGYRRK